MDIKRELQILVWTHLESRGHPELMGTHHIGALVQNVECALRYRIPDLIKNISIEKFIEGKELMECFEDIGNRKRPILTGYNDDTVNWRDKFRQTVARGLDKTDFLLITVCVYHVMKQWSEQDVDILIIWNDLSMGYVNIDRYMTEKILDNKTVSIELTSVGQVVTDTIDQYLDASLQPKL